MCFAFWDYIQKKEPATFTGGGPKQTFNLKKIGGVGVPQAIVGAKIL